MEKKIGKIKKVWFGYGGYQDAMFGITFSLGSDKECWGVQDFKGTWGSTTEITEQTKWTEQDRRNENADVMVFIDSLMIKAKVRGLNDLAGIPVEATFEGMALKKWRVLEEVI